ncbi:MAG: hypothetical protein Q8O40_05510 [Chloroflexota bacterium]|nr:hypothetical protein [Chloroflexota bacterium]
MPDKETAQKVKALGQASVRHAETVSRAIACLGEEPTTPTLEALPDPLDLREFFRLQLEYEKLALWLHSKAAELVPPEMASQFRQIAKEEESHITLTEAILGRLEQGPHKEEDPPM